MITARVECTRKTEHGEGEDRRAAVTFFADAEDEGNQEWAHETPSLSLSMTVKGELADGYEQGERYTITIEDPAS